MTKKEVQKAYEEGTWLVWSKYEDFLIQLGNISTLADGHYVFRKRDRSSKDVYPGLCKVENLRPATAKDFLELTEPPLR